MCGIAALWRDRDSDTVQRLLSNLIHRGPDGEGLETLGRGPGVLGHRRLAIIDPDGGRQPMTAGGGSDGLVANGMIYNYAALRDELPAGDFATRSDSETILHGFRAWGPDVVPRLDGMFAFVLVSDGRLVAARDPIGIKPLYTGRVGDAIAFASEIKALAGVATDIEEFPAGHVLDTAEGLARYYDVPEPEDADWSVEETLARVRATLDASVRKRLRSDVPLGCFLSGGLDSSLIAALARRRVEELHTFAVGLEGSADLDNARRVAEHLDTIHHEQVIEHDEAIDALPGVVRHLESYDRDLVRNAVPCWFVSRLAAEAGMKVVLTGEGADELFAGYDYYADYDGDDEALQWELRRSILAMHDVNLQRVDRMTMANSLEARVPFLDTAMIDLAMRIPAALKRRDRSGRRTEKWVLRAAFEDLLPHDVVWRDKERFDEGSGFADVFAGLGARLARRAGRPGPGEADRAEEAHYRDLLAASLGEDVLDLTSLWREDRVAA